MFTHPHVHVRESVHVHENIGGDMECHKADLVTTIISYIGPYTY